jgi:hypothetical protein
MSGEASVNLYNKNLVSKPGRYMEFGEKSYEARKQSDFGQDDQLIEAILRGVISRTIRDTRRFEREQTDPELRSHGHRERLAARIRNDGLTT